VRVLINALSVTNQSGRHVLMGHLNQLRRWTEGEHDYVILHHDSNQDIVTPQPEYRWVKCPPETAQWAARARWEYRNLNRLAADTASDFIFTPAGVTVPGIERPQVVFCQNPWCLVPELHQTWKDKAKATLQRRSYRRTMGEAALMVFNSQYMSDAYRVNAGFDAASSLIVYQAISDQTWTAAADLGKSLREKNHIVSVSAMAPHKAADVLVRSLRLVHHAGVKARLTFAGGWPDAGYRARVEGLVESLGLKDAVTFTGWISEHELHRLYSRADLFCLLSRCESFGIPAVEAQSFGTPALGTDTCAIPEVGGAGGLYSSVDNAQSAAENILRCLTDDGLWRSLSDAAKTNALRFRWDTCSRPLLQMFDAVSVSP